MGLPVFMLEFKKKAETAAARAERGIVAVILADNTKNEDKYISYNYSNETEIVASHWAAENYAYLKQIFLSKPKRVIVQRAVFTDKAEYKDVLEILKNKSWNYLTIPGIDTAAEDSENITSVKDVCNWINNARTAKRRFKAVLPCTAAGVKPDSEGIIDFATENITVGAKTYTAAQYCPRIAGILATVPLSESGTNIELPEVEKIKESVSPDNDIDSGKLILINDGEKIKIARAVNSLTTLSDTKTADMKKIKIVDAMDFIFDDIKAVFETSYMGKANSYDNKQLFISAVNDYLKDLASQSILDSSGENRVEVDVEKQEEWLKEQGVDTSLMTSEQIKTAKTGSFMFICGNLSFLDAVEDLLLAIYM